MTKLTSFFAQILIFVQKCRERHPKSWLFFRNSKVGETTSVQARFGQEFSKKEAKFPKNQFSQNWCWNRGESPENSPKNVENSSNMSVDTLPFTEQPKITQFLNLSVLLPSICRRYCVCLPFQARFE